MAVKHGNLSINSENIFPIIKKWLYSDHDIFVRELVSNGCDAIYSSAACPARYFRPPADGLRLDAAT